jgi:hypothetical protein
MKCLPMKNALITLAAAASLFAGACTPLSAIESREVMADRLARPAFMVERVIPAGMFNLAAWERIHAKYTPATVYIEGDGLAWLSKSRPSLNPTPKNPVGLHLAAMDKSKNVAWLARPCQYTGWNGEGACPDRYWTGARFAPEVVASYHAALDNMKAMYGIPGFHLVGYSGGASVAALVAAERDDILSLRTVAGNLDHAAWTAHHDVSPLTESLNPLTAAPALMGLPQHHFIGGQDDIIPPAIFHSWKQASGETDCVHYTFITENEHEKGWPAKWPELLGAKLDCEGPPPPPPAPIPPEFFEVKK